MEAAWQFTSRAIKIFRLCWIQQAFLESLCLLVPMRGGHAHAQVKEASLGVLLRHNTSIAVSVGAVLEGSVGVVEPHRKLTNPGSGRGCWDSVLKVSLKDQGIFVEGPTVEVCIAMWLEHPRGGRGAMGMHLMVLHPKMSLISAQCSQPHQDSSHQGHRRCLAAVLSPRALAHP